MSVARSRAVWLPVALTALFVATYLIPMRGWLFDMQLYRVSAIGARLHGKNKLELIYYSDFDRKIISRESKHAWLVIKPIAKARLEFVRFGKDFSPGFQYSSWGRMEQATVKSNQAMERTADRCALHS